jgi:hypothetical protein
MNIIKLQDQLKGVPDKTLVGYVKNPTGQIPTYLALSELERRKTMRENYQANTPEAKTVAEDLVEKYQPPAQGVAALPQAQPTMQAMASAPAPEMPVQQMAQGGVAELDVGDMYDENNFASGGIVAFAKGGYSYDPETDNPEEYASMLDQMLAAEEERYRVETPEFGMHPGLAMQHRKKMNEIYKVAPTPYDKAIEYYISTNQPGAAGALESKKREWLYNKEVRTPKGITSLDATNLKQNPLVDTKAAAQDGKGGYTYQPGESATKGPSDTYFDTINQFMPKGSAADNLKVDRLKYDPTLFTKDNEDPEAEFTKGAERYTKYMGDNEAVKKQEARLAAREEGLKAREKQNLGMSLLTGGLDVLSGTSPFAAVNLGRAKSGVEQYIRGADRIQDLREKIDDAGFALDQAKRAEQTAAFKYGDEDRRTAKATKIANEREQKLYNLKVQEQNITTGLKEKELGLQGQLVDIKRADLAKDIAFGNRQLQMYESRIDKMDEATKAKFASIKAKGIIEANKYIQGNPPEVRALVKQFTDQGKKTYGNPEFDGQLQLIKQGIIGQYLNSMQDELGLTDTFANVPSATDLLNRRQTVQ